MNPDVFPSQHSHREDKIFWGWLAVYILAATGFWLHDIGAFAMQDSYFYLVTARNIVLHGTPSFNLLYLNNGLHPLWLMLLSVYEALISAANPQWLYRGGFAIPLVLGLLAGGAYFFNKAARPLRIEPVLLVSFPLVYLTALGVLYSEAYINFFSLGILTALAVKVGPDRKQEPVWIGLAAAAVFLARLDSIFFLGAFFIWYWSRQGSFSRAFFAGLIFSGIVGVYLIFNQYLFGGIEPISGWMKSTFPHVHAVGFHGSPGPGLFLMNYNVLFGIGPIVFTGLVVAVCFKRISGARTFIYPLLAGTCLHFLYTGLFTQGFCEWYWYYVANVVMGAMSFSILVADWPRWRPAPHILGLTAALLAMTYLYIERDRPPYNPEWPLTDSYVARNDIRDTTILVSEFPGSVAFYSTNRIIAADFLTGNISFYKQMVSSPNALLFLRDYCIKQGKPIKYIIFNKGYLLVPSKDRKSIYYYDPRNYRRKIGEMRVGDPIYAQDDPPFLVWELK